MILSDTSIKKFIKQKFISIRPSVVDSNIRPTGIRLHLGDEISIPNENITVDLNQHQENLYRKINIGNTKYTLKPQELVLASSLEEIKTNNELVCYIDGRSTLARLGLFVHCSSTTFDNIHEEYRTITFEIYNCGKFSVNLQYKSPIAMLSFIQLSSPITQKSQVQYKNQKGAQEPNLKFNINESKSK